jgi:hypothetical protein
VYFADGSWWYGEGVDPITKQCDIVDQCGSRAEAYANAYRALGYAEGAEAVQEENRMILDRHPEIRDALEQAENEVEREAIKGMMERVAKRRKPPDLHLV